MTKIYDPMTDEELDVYCKDANSDEVYRANEEKAIAVICNKLRVARKEAIRLLENSDIDNPINCKVCEFWCE